MFNLNKKRIFIALILLFILLIGYGIYTGKCGNVSECSIKIYKKIVIKTKSVINHIKEIFVKKN
jgi:hypothetical protein